MKSHILVSSLMSLAAAINFPFEHKRKHYTRNNSTLFDVRQSIYRCKNNISSILTPADGERSITKDTVNIPTIFFTIKDPKFRSGTSIFVLEKFAAYEVLEGGRDSTSDYRVNKEVYFGSDHGIYRFIPEALSSRKFGTINDDILQIQKALNGDIVMLNSQNKLFRVSKNGTVKKRIPSIYCVKQFVLDTSDNIYYIGCKNHSLHIIPFAGRKMSIPHIFREILLIRPPFILRRSIPLLGDGRLFMLSENGSLIGTDLVLKEKPTAVSVDAALYFVAAFQGGIYELNVMELLLKSVFRIPNGGHNNISKVIISIMGPTLENYKSFDMLQ